MEQEPQNIAELEPLPDESQVNLAEYLRLIRRRLGRIAIVAVGLAGIALMWSTSQTPIYKSTAGVVIESQAPQVLRMTEETGRFEAEEFQTHVNLMTSFHVLRDTVKRLDIQRWPEYQIQESALKSLLVGLGLEWVIDLKNQIADRLGALKELLMPESSPPTISYEGLSAEAFPTKAERDLVERFRRNVLIEAIRGSMLVRISVLSESAKNAARAANTLAAVYIDKTLESRAKSTESASQWFASHLNDLRTKVEDSERALHAYRMKYGLVNVNDQQSISVQKLAQLNSELVRAEVARAQIETRYQRIKEIKERSAMLQKGESLIKSDLDLLPEMMNSEVMQTLRAREVELSLRKAQLAEKYGPLHPSMISVRTELEEVRARIVQELDTLYRNMGSELKLALAQEQAVREQLAQEKQIKLDLEKHAVQYSLLEREANSNRQIYDLFLKQMRETDLSAQVKTSNVFLAESAVPNPYPVFPNVPLNTILGLVLGLVLSVGFVLLREFLDGTIKSPEEAERLLPGLAFLGWVPKLAKKSGLNPDRIMQVEPMSAAADRYRHIRTSASLAAQGMDPLSIVITSPLEHEGKTALAANLAIAFSQIEDCRVVLIDTDLRRPRIHKIFRLAQKIDKPKGLTQYLSGEVEAKEILHTTQIPNLVVIPSGGTPSNPAELLFSPKMSSLVQWCREQGYLVILDAPPLLIANDTLAISQKAHSPAIIALSAGETPSESAKKAVQSLFGHGIPVLGIVLQNVPEDRIPKHYTYYSQRPRKDNGKDRARE